MTVLHYTAEVKSGLLLELPTEAEVLHLRPGDKVEVRLVQPAQSRKAETKNMQRAASEVQTEPKLLRGRGKLAGVLSSEDFMRRKREDVAREDRPLL